MNKQSKENVSLNKNNLNLVEIYNLRVIDNLERNPLTKIQKASNKIFIDQLDRIGLTNAQFNVEVEKYNEQHGMLIEKRNVSIKDHPFTNPNYNYLNYAYIDKEAKELTMNNFRKFKYAHNTKAKKDNKNIAEYNNNIASPCNSRLATQFLNDYSHLKPEQYNLLVEKFNTKNGMVLKKKRIPMLANQHEMTFETLLNFYIKQLKDWNLKRMNTGHSTRMLKKEMLKLEVNTRALAIHKLSGVPRLDVCVKTARNRIKRLRELGLLTNYIYRGHKLPVCVNFNPSILVVFDFNQPKRSSTEKIGFNEQKGKNLPNKRNTTRTELKEKEKKRNDHISFITNELKLFKNDYAAHSYKITRNVKNSEQPKWSQNSHKISKNSDSLEYLIKDRWELSKELSENVYQDYSPIIYPRLLKEVQYGSMSKEDFRELCIQDFIKTSAKIWKKCDSVYPSSWMKAMEILDQRLFKTNFQGNNGMFHKEKIVEHLTKYRFLITWANQWFIKNKYKNILYPNLYFDNTRTTKKEVGFFALGFVWKKHQDKVKKNHEDRVIRNRNASIRKEKISNRRKFDRYLSKYNKGKIDFNALLTYCKNNLPLEFYENIEYLISDNSPKYYA